MAADSLDQFLERSYQGEPAEAREFSVDTERGKEVLRHALRDDPEYFLADLLAVANLAGSGEFSVTSQAPRGVLGRAVLGSKLTLTIDIPGRACSESELKALPDQMYQTQDRFFFRLSLALNRLCLLESGRFVLESWDGESRHSYEMKRGVASYRSQPASLQTTKFEGMRVKVWDLDLDYYMRGRLRRKSVQGCSRLILDGVEARGFAAEDYLWSKTWLNDRIPLREGQTVERSPGDFSMLACLSSGTVDKRMSLAPVLDGVQLAELELSQENYPQYFVPGLTIFVRRDSWRLDASHRRLVVGESLKSDIKEYLDLILSALTELTEEDRTVTKQYLLANRQTPALQSVVDDMTVTLKDGKSLPCSELSGIQTLSLRRLVAEEDQMFLELCLQEPLPFQFRQGYSFADDSLISANGRWFANSSPWHVMVLSLRDLGSDLVLNFLRPTVEKVVFHTSQPWVAILTTQELWVRNLEDRQEICRLEMECSDLDFATCDNWLYLIEGPGAKSQLRRLRLPDGELEPEKTEVPSGEFHVVGEFALFLGDEVSVFDLPKPDLPLCKFSLPFGAYTLEDVSPDFRRVVLRNTAGWELAVLDLAKMTHAVLPSMSLALRFSWDSDYLLGQDVHDHSRVIQRSFQAQTIKVADLTESRVKIGKSGMGMRLRNGRVFEAKESLYPAPIKALFQLKEVPRLGQITDTLTPPQEVPEALAESLVGYRDSGQGRAVQLNLWSKGEWNGVWLGLTLECSLAPECFSWESPKGVFSLDRQTGELRNHPGAQLAGSALLRPKGKAVHLVHPLTGKNGPRVLKPSKAWALDCSFPQCYTRYLTISPGFKSDIVDVREARVLGRVSSFTQLQSNGEWLLRTVLDLNVKYVQYFKRPGPLNRWKKAPMSGLVLHPSEPKGFYATKEGVGLFNLVSLGGRYQPSCDKSSVSLSPAGKFVLRQSSEDSASTIVDAESLEFLGRIPGSGSWLSESVLWAQGLLWVTDPKLGWRRPWAKQYLDETASQWDERCGVVADGTTETFVYRRAGQFDILNARSGAIKAILHPLGEEWFVFRLDGAWDCSPGALEFVVGEPDPELREPGLLWEAVRIVAD